MSRRAPVPTAAAGSHPEVLVAVDGLRKHYGARKAVDGISFSVYPGETFGLLGPNGAGKTTTLEIMAGLLRPDGGDVTICGYSVASETKEAQLRMGVVPQGLALYEDLTARQNLNYFGKLRGILAEERRRQIREILEITGLQGDADRKVAAFSGGMKRRLNIGIGLLGKPRVLLLDEPTVGIDPQSRRHILDAVRRLAQSGMTVVYTSHYMEEVEYLCRRVAIMDHGRIIAQGPIDEVRALAGESVLLRLPLRDDALGKSPDIEALRGAVAVPVEAAGGELRFLLPEGARQAPAVLNALVELDIPLDGMRLEAPNLEAVFLALTGKGLRDPGSGEGEVRRA